MQDTNYTNAILAHKKNGGIHSIRQMKSVQTMLTTHDLKKAVMYQFILSGSTKAEYQATIKALVRHIRTKCKAEYLGAYEVGDEKGGLHCHCYIIIETLHHYPADLLDVSEGHFIARRIKRKAKQAKEAGLDKSLSIRIEPPKGRMHGGAMFAKMDTPAKLADCIAWCSYHVKVRSKNAGQDRETYFASEFASNTGKREAQRQKYRDALTKSSRPAANKESIKPESLKVAAAEEQGYLESPIIPKQETTLPMPRLTTGHQSTSKGETMTPAFKYVAGLYETAVDAGMNVAEIQSHLKDNGIPRSLWQVRNDLSNVFGFTGYADAHTAPPRPDVAELDKMIDRMPERLLQPPMGLTRHERTHPA